MSHMITDDQIPEAFLRMRRKVTLQSLALLGFIAVAMAAWMFAYHYLGGRSGTVFLAGEAVILLAAFLYTPRIERQVVCPACSKSLADTDGWNLFVNTCPHCGVGYERRAYPLPRAD